mgnify:CR=1 FL=1
MHEPYRSPAHEPGAHERAYPAGQTESFETRAFDVPTAETRQFPPAQSPLSSPVPYPAQGRAPSPAPQPYPPGPERPARRPPTGHRPLAHEGGLPYGNPPAPAYPQPQQFVPQHLAVPHQFGAGPFPQHAGPYPQHEYPYMYPPQPFQQTVVVHNSRRVNHALHLVLTLLTAGLWLPVWIILAIANS